MSMLIVHELHEARDRLLLLKDNLNRSQDREIQAYRPFIQEQLALIDDALVQAKIPDSYRVAVVGRFKVGKSQFVNKLLGVRLAGVHSNPETAAISVFRYSDEARAEIELVSREEWERLRADHAEDPDNAEVKRFHRFTHFNEKSSKVDSSEERMTFDLHRLVEDWVWPDGKVHHIKAGNWETDSGRKAFLAEIRKFTTSREPLHYLVNKLTIYAPVPLLRDQIELVDTPGLDDTERFRVLLTEELVKDVDAILFLTTSGAAYGQSDKDFILRQLRRRQIKHLQLILTKADQTYESAIRDAKESGSEPPSFDAFRNDQIRRVRGETASTLSELLQSNQLTDEEGYYFIEQLDEVPVQLISARYHDDGDITKGGIDAVRDGLYRILSTSHRFEQSRTILRGRLDIILTRLQKSYAERLNSLERDFDPAKVREEIESIRSLLGKQLERFGVQSGEAVGLLAKGQEAFFKTLPVHLDLLGMQAKEVLNDLEKSDLVKHWKTRRCGYWGYMADLQGRVADRVFPRVESLLNMLYGQLQGFMRESGTRLASLQRELETLESQHQLSGLESIDLASTLDPIFENLKKQFDGVVEAEKEGIVSNLEDFVTEEVQQRLDAARQEVAEIVGRGTTIRQAGQVAEFYGTVRSLLADALRKHLDTRIREFAEAVKASADSVAPKIGAGAEGVMRRRLEAIESSLQVASQGQKEQVKGYLGEMLALVSNFAADPKASPTPIPRPQIKSEATTEVTTQVVTAPIEVSFQEQHYEIPDGATGFTYERIFRPYIDTAEEIQIEDPYIRKPFQIDNLLRFCALAVRIGTVKKIGLVTGEDFGEDVDEINGRLETLRRDLAGRSIDFTWRRDGKIHDREIRLDNGWIIKVGRGLDFYQKPDSWVSVAAADFSLRSCRQTKVDVFKRQMTNG